MISRLCILMPLYDDWQALHSLISRIKECVSGGTLNELLFVIVNDCSTIFDPFYIQGLNSQVTLLHLNKNVGHQKAIAVGLAYIADNIICDYVIVMDADGEDKPEHINELMSALSDDPNTIIFARRTKRHEGFIFRFYYVLYKLLFKICTGKTINFGNFCIIPWSLMQRIVYLSDIYNHFSGGIIRSKLSYKAIPLERGRRLAGSSKMNLSSLILHGLSVFSIHVETVAVRLLVATCLLICFCLLGIMIIILTKLFTTLAIPGWATSSVMGLLIIIVQAFLMSLFVILIIMNYRTQKHSIPALDYKENILTIETSDNG